MTNSDVTCEAFDAALPDYLEGTLDGSLRASVERHLRECVRCAGLVRDLENIRDEAAALPDLVPSRDLWAGIEARIAAPVIPLAARPEKQRRLVPAWMGIAAAALIMSTAGITYMLTARSLRPGDDGRVAGATPTSQTLPTNAAIPSEATAATESTGVGGAQNSPDKSGVARFAQRPAETSPSGVGATRASRDQSGPSSSDAVYGREIEMLQNIVKQRKTQLDSSTVAVIQKNLEIIDTAIEQSRAALARDPASRMLSQQLTHALDKKVELLRTAALLPAST
ncbi:MAG TPA: zf-HC2 domain-containing protein [Gemmatimonadaceae bacterium]|nr:zf-HC2 domain-containing protein [Gemmatimonadaceae bacterium]